MSYDPRMVEIAERIADAILSENLFSKEQLVTKIAPILKIWIHVKDKPQLGKVRKNSIDEMIQIQQKYKLEMQFWKEIVKKLTNKPMQEHYDQLKILCST